MKNITLLLISIFSFAFAALAQNQKVVLCESYDEKTGATTGVNKSWDIKKDGGSYVYVIYSQDKIIKDRLSLYVDKKNATGSFIAYDTQDFDYNPSTDKKNWAMYDLKFTEDGDYRISVMGKGEDALAITYTNIAYMKDDGTSNTNDSKEYGTDDEKASDTYYYEGSEITFGESAEEGVMKGESTEFNLINGVRNITCMLKQDNDLLCKEIVVSVYGGKDYQDLISEETFTVGGMNWNWIKVPLTVKKVGKYVVDIYNDKDTFVNSGYFEIK